MVDPNLRKVKLAVVVAGDVFDAKASQRHAAGQSRTSILKQTGDITKTVMGQGRESVTHM